MRQCNALTEPSFEGLVSLQTVGDFWMARCNALTNPRFEGLDTLETVGDEWMYKCPKLRSKIFPVNAIYNAVNGLNDSSYRLIRILKRDSKSMSESEDKRDAIGSIMNKLLEKKFA
jgi:hypothetical protein